MRFLTLAIALFTGLALAAPTEQTESVGLERRQMMNQRTCVPANCAHCIVSKVETYLPQSVLDKQAARRAAVNPGEIPKPIEYTGYERELVRRAVLNYIGDREQCFVDSKCELRAGECDKRWGGTAIDRLIQGPNTFRYRSHPKKA